jgi:hypothetical protein
LVCWTAAKAAGEVATIIAKSPQNLKRILYCTGDGSSLCRRAGDQGAEGAAPGPEEGEEHQAQRQRHHGRHHQRRQDHAAQVHGQGILRRVVTYKIPCSKK